MATSTKIAAIRGSTLASETRVLDALLLTSASSSSKHHPIRSHPSAPAFEVKTLSIEAPLLLRSTSSSRISSSMCKQPVSDHLSEVDLSAENAFSLCFMSSCRNSLLSTCSHPDGKTGAIFLSEFIASLRTS